MSVMQAKTMHSEVDPSAFPGAGGIKPGLNRNKLHAALCMLASAAVSIAVIGCLVNWLR